MTLVESYVDGLIAELKAVSGFPAPVERSTTRAFGRKDPLMLVVHLGKEDIDSEMIGAVHRSREILFSIISRGDVPDREAGQVMEAAHPVIKQFNGPGLMGVEEIKTDQPIFSNTDGQACMITVHYLFRYRTAPFSLSS